MGKYMNFTSDLATHSQDFNKERIQTRIEFIKSVIEGLILTEAEENNWNISSNIMKTKSLIFDMKETNVYNHVPSIIKLGHYLSSFLVEINNENHLGSGKIHSIAQSYYEISKFMLDQRITNIANEIILLLR